MRIVIPGRPHPKGRPRFGRGRAYTPKETREWEDMAAAIARQTGVRLEGPVSVSIWACYATKTGHGDWFTGGADIDNIEKAVLDALQKGGVIVNDRKVVQVYKEKIKDVESATIVEVRDATPFDLTKPTKKLEVTPATAEQILSAVGVTEEEHAKSMKVLADLGYLKKGEE